MKWHDEYDESFLSRLKSSDQDAWTRLYAEVTPIMHRTLYTRTKDTGLREDLVQETILHLYRNIHRIESLEELNRAIYRSTLQRQVDHWKNRHNRDSIMEFTDINSAKEQLRFRDAAEPEQYYHVSIQQLHHAVSRAVNKLQSNHRDVLTQIYWEGKTTDECAQFLDVPKGTIKSRKNHAENSLRRLLGPTVSEACSERVRNSRGHAAELSAAFASHSTE
jgi:RNA polymerase sigma-70 factor (ECF subfamily)